MAAISATCDSTSVGPSKEKKSWREISEYLHNRSDIARILWCKGFVIVCDLVALRQMTDKVDTGPQ